MTPLVKPGELQVRDGEVIDLQARRPRTGSGFAVSGIAAPFGQVADIGAFSESYEYGAFTSVIAARKTVFALNHDVKGWTLASQRSGSLRLDQDRMGLRFDVDLPPTALGEHVYVMADRGDWGGVSIAFLTVNGGDKWGKKDDKPHRTVHAVSHLRDVGLVTTPAYSQTPYSVGTGKINRNAELVRLHEMRQKWHEQELHRMRFDQLEENARRWRKLKREYSRL